MAKQNPAPKMISVCLATYNGEQYLRQQLESIYPQLSKEDELLISDDGSTDGTLKILESYNDDHTTIFHNNFRNPVRNFEFLFKKASRPIIVPCDQDDIWLPEKLETIRSGLREQTKTCLLMNAELIDKKGEKTGLTSFAKWRMRTGFWPNLLRNTYMGSSMAFTSDLLQTALPFPDKIAMHDWWIGLLAEKTGKLRLIKEPMMLYRIHGRNTSLQGSSMLQKLKWRLQMLSAIYQRLSNG